MARQHIFIKLAVVALTLSSLAGCKSEITALLRIRDIIDAVPNSGPEPVAVLQIGLQVPSAEACQTLTTQLPERAKPYGLTPENITCTEHKFENFIQFRSLLTMHAMQLSNGDGTVHNAANELFRVVVATQQGKKQYNVVLVYNRGLFAQFQQSLKQENPLYGSSFNDLELSLNIENDSREDKLIVVQSAFVDGNPVVGSQTFTLKPRQLIDVRFSDVQVAYFGNNGYIDLAAITTPQ
jgi:hypothetical protein